MFRDRTDQSEKEKVRDICKAHKGVFVNNPDGSYKCSGVLEDTIEFDLGKKSLRDTGSPSRLKDGREDRQAEFAERRYG